MPNEYSVSNLRRFIHHGMVDHTSLIWINHILCRFIARDMVDHTSLIWSYHNFYHSLFVAWLTLPAKYGTSVNETEYFYITQHLYGSIRT